MAYDCNYISIISTERDSTWNVASDNFDDRWETQAFSVGQLVKSEIKDLIRLLKVHSALGVLTPLSAEEQIRAFEESDRHLLVAMHEVTKGKPFEEIVIDECRSLVPEKARQLYLDICTLNQFGAPVRAGLMNRISSIPFTAFQRDFFAPLQGVVLTQQNRYTGDHEYKARHPRIASLVFKQAFPEDGDRVRQLERVIGSLDEGYNADREAITELIKASNLIVLLTDVEYGRDIYNRVQSLLGEKWYVHHQRANFELNHSHGSLEEAEAEAQQALGLVPKRGSVLHTLAETSRLRAKKEPDGNRKVIYRQQVRERLRKISTDRSSYADGSRCKLRLDELLDAVKGLDLQDEENVRAFAEMSKLARDSIDKAISRHPTDPNIARLRADFFDILQDNESAKLALEHAWRLKPKGPGVALQLARMYRKDGNVSKSLEAIQEALERYPQDVGVNYEMARHILHEGNNVERVDYYLGRSYNLSDRNYKARYLHAQYCFLVNKGEQSLELFNEVNRMAPSDFRPQSDVDKGIIWELVGRVNGRIVRHEESYGFIKLPIYPNDIYSNSSNSNADQWRKLTRQAKVSCEVGFNRVGPVAIDVRSV